MSQVYSRKYVLVRKLFAPAVGEAAEDMTAAARTGVCRSLKTALFASRKERFPLPSVHQHARQIEGARTTEYWKLLLSRRWPCLGEIPQLTPQQLSVRCSGSSCTWRPSASATSPMHRSPAPAWMRPPSRRVETGLSPLASSKATGRPQRSEPDAASHALMALGHGRERRGHAVCRMRGPMCTQANDETHAVRKRSACSAESKHHSQMVKPGRSHYVEHPSRRSLHHC